MERDATRQHASFDVLVRRARLRAGLTQEQLADLSGLSTRTISDIERGVYRYPHRSTLGLLSTALGLSDAERAEWSRVRRQRVGSTPETRTADNASGLDGETDLPAILTSFVGRRQEIETLISFLNGPNTRLVTLTGTGGVGKTRLALAVASEVRGRFRDGVRFIDLAPITDSNLVLSRIATALQVQPAANRPIVAVLATNLRSREMLLVLDNLEQVVEAAPGIGQLIGMCPTLRILATSRVPLHLRCEQEFPVPPLTVPAISNELLPLDDWRRWDAVSLFLLRARAVRPDFSITPENVKVVLDLCQRLGGVPLMIELAAARLRSLAVEDILSRLDQSLTLLKTQARDVPERQQTLRATIEWSYKLLTDKEQRVFRFAGAFHGGFTLAALTAVADGESDLATLDVLEPLIEHGLIQQHAGLRGASRYAMLEMLREFALELLHAHGEAEIAHEQHVRFFLEFAEEARDHLHAADQNVWIATLEQEHDNVVAAMRWSVKHRNTLNVEATIIALRFGAALWWFWFVRGFLREAQNHLDAAIRMGRELLSAPQPGVDPTELTRVFASCLLSFATISFWIANYDLALTLLEECLEIQTRLGDEQGMAVATIFTAFGLSRVGKFDAAERLLETGIELHRKRGDRAGTALGLLGYGELALRRGDYAHGEARTRESRSHFSDLGDTRSVIAADATIGALRLCQGDLESAGELLRQSLVARQRLGDQGGMAWTLEWLARLELAETGGNAGAAKAAQLLGAARQIRDATGSEMDPADRPSYEAFLTSVQRRLSDTAFVVAWEAGRAMPPDQVVALGLSGADVCTQPQSNNSGLSLSARETEVLELVADGLSDRQIADLLNVSPRTVNTHVTHILNKLGVMSRTAAAAKAVRLRLI